MCAQMDARRLERMSVLDAGRTRRFARAATEAPIQVVLKHGILPGQIPLRQSLHEDDPAARAICFVVGRAVGRATLQAEAAVDARIEAGSRLCGHGLASSGTASVPAGSNVSRSRETRGVTPSRYAPK